jgi:hypothetical protein
LLNLLLSLGVEFIHSICVRKKRATHCSHAGARVQSDAGYYAWNI